MFGHFKKPNQLIAYMPIDKYSSFANDIGKTTLYSKHIKSMTSECIMLEKIKSDSNDPKSFTCYIESGHTVIGSNREEQPEYVRNIAFENKKKKTLTTKITIQMVDAATISYYKTLIEEGELKKYKDYFKYE